MSNADIARLLGINPWTARLIARKFRHAGAPNPRCGKWEPAPVGLVVLWDTAPASGDSARDRRFLSYVPGKSEGLLMPRTNLDETINALKSYAETKGWPSRREWNRFATEHGLASAEALYYHLGSWEALRTKLGFPRREKRFSKEECVQAVKLAAEEYGPFIKREEYREWQKKHPGMPTPAQVSRRCGGFNRTKELAGLVPNRVIGKTFDDEEIRRVLLDCARDLGKTKFSEDEYSRWREEQERWGGKGRHVETVRVWLGGFLLPANRELGLDSYEKGVCEKYDEDTWLPPLVKFIEEALSVKSCEDWRKENAGPSVTVLRRFAGNYQKALKEAVAVYLRRLGA